MSNTHLDMTSIVQEEIRKDRLIRPGKEGDLKAHRHFSISEGDLINERYGPQQVQGLLRMVIDPPLHKALEDAADDTDALDHLAAHKGKTKSRLLKSK